MPATREADFLSPLAEDALFFRRLVGLEELGRLPEYRVELVRLSDKPAIKPADLLGKNVSVKLQLADGEFRFWNGWVTSFEQGGTEGRFDVYELELRPWLWYLTLGADCKIFADKSAVEIIKAVFADYGSQQIDDKLKVTYRKRNFCVQYRESDFAFVSRLMEEEGIYYYFKHAQGQHKLVLCDGPPAHAAIAGAKLDWAAVQTDGQLRDDTITRWRRAHSVQSLKYAHTDFDFEAPSTDLATQAVRTASHPKPGDLEVFDYPGRYDDLAQAGNTGAEKTEGSRLARLRIDAFESQQDVATALSAYRPLGAGWNFTFADHPDAGDYLITRARVEARFSGYEAAARRDEDGFTCRFEAVPKAAPFQPQPVTPRPTIAGPQTALVTGASGDEIHTDKYGRVKLQFRWDRLGKKNETSSGWVRVSQPWASKQFGFVALPRVGDEVVVEFLDGNPDRPLVTGRVYNAENMPPYALPAQATVSGMKTRSSKGGGAGTFNELRFDDKKGSEYVWFQAEKDHHHWVKNDAWTTVQNDQWSVVEKNAGHKVGETMALEVGKTATVKVAEDTHVTLGADLNLGITGALNVEVGEAVALKGGAAIAVTASAGIDIAAGAALNVKAASTLHVKGLGIVIDGGTQLCIKAGGAFITLGPEGVTIQGTLVKINSGGAAGSATAAANAAPAKPKAPAAPKANTDPLAS